jgi:hypothetical protein
MAHGSDSPARALRSLRSNISCACSIRVNGE